MKNFLTLIIFSFSILILTSCGKDEVPKPEYYYKFKVNGVQKEFKASDDASIFFTQDQGSTNRRTLFTMVSGTDPLKNTIVMSYRSPTSIVVGNTYQMQAPIIIGGVENPSILFFYFDENGKEYGASLLKSSNPGANDNVFFSFTEFSNENSKGNFEAVIFDLSATGDLNRREVVEITEGEFFLPNFISIL
ncbi:hypothetical protein M3O96_19580 [Aquiflexum sp. TKW24L]|uniref:hypothetical protein n=1 Tax=Aquiflexum sp. TKW24L TaxID=2942212 RepID=UPI0020BDFF31|nr:hypothetical protein [Aquiflexum sp. TKW24L]MCL6261312.1 hypothetical protein [Aquiflexum sp. TKW24L]